MNDEHEPGTTPGDTPGPQSGPPAGETPGPGQDAEIRALLAELGSGPDGEELPPEVAARLEDTLALLVAERGREESPATAGSAASPDASTGPSTGPSTGNVVPMHRRWAPRLAGAAAAVIVLGAGGVAAANLGLLDDSSPSVSDSTAGGASDGKAESAPGSSAPSTGDDASERLTAQAASLPQLRATTFATDAERLLQGRATLTAPQDLGDKQGMADARLREACPGPRFTDGSVSRPVLYDGELAFLAVRPERDGHRLVEAWDCAGSQRLARAKLTP